MEEGSRIVDLMKEVKSAKRAVERAIRIYGPDNIDSILDKETYEEKLEKITAKLETFLEKADEGIDMLDELKGSEPNIAIDKKIEEIKSCSQAIENKVQQNESEVKKKIREVMEESSNSKSSDLGSSTISSTKRLNTNNSSSSRKITDLTQKINNYNEAGPFLTHLPQFVFAAKHVIKQYQKKLPEFGYMHHLYQK